MAYLFIINVALIIGFITYVVVTQNERKDLIELLAAKDYADYKNFQREDEYVSRKDRKTMFSARDMQDKIKMDQE